MNVLVVTPYAGSKKLVEMTNRMLHEFAICAAGLMKHKFFVVAVNNAAEGDIHKGLADRHLWMRDDNGQLANEGFGRAINTAIRSEIFDMKDASYTHVLCLNNDLEFSDHKDWLEHLLRVAPLNRVSSPCTDITAATAAKASGPVDDKPRAASQVSAFCWLVPVEIIKLIRRRFGWELFHPEFSNYGSDDVTGAVLRRLVAPQPFLVVPRSWVKHLKAQTANELGVKAGTKDLLQRITNFKRANRLA